MNRIDPQKEARVWERVKGAQMESSSPEAGIQNLLANEWASASAYLQIARQMSSREAAILQRLAREEQTHAACLKGIFAGEQIEYRCFPCVGIADKKYFFGRGRRFPSGSFLNKRLHTLFTRTPSAVSPRKAKSLPPTRP